MSPPQRCLHSNQWNFRICYLHGKTDFTNVNNVNKVTGLKIGTYIILHYLGGFNLTTWAFKIKEHYPAEVREMTAEAAKKMYVRRANQILHVSRIWHGIAGSKI